MIKNDVYVGSFRIIASEPVIYHSCAGVSGRNNDKRNMAGPENIAWEWTIQTNTQTALSRTCSILFVM